MNWKIKLGNFLFKYRSFTPVPVIVFVFLVFRPLAITKTEHLVLNLVGILIAFSGEFIRILAVGYSFEGTSGRESFLKAESLNVSGIYSLVRNPLYIGNFFIFSGILVIFANIFAIATMALFLFFQYYFIILSEEHFLKENYGEQFLNYCSTTNRILLTFKNYRPAVNNFNLKKVIFKENDSIFNMLVMILAIFFYKNSYLNKNPQIHFYLVILTVFLLAYITIKVIKKRYGKGSRKRGR